MTQSIHYIYSTDSTCSMSRSRFKFIRTNDISYSVSCATTLMLDVSYQRYDYLYKQRHDVFTRFESVDAFKRDKEIVTLPVHIRSIYDVCYHFSPKRLIVLNRLGRL